uniref:DNA polymerase alpha subunit B isoform X2 n=1 Tax=Myxine glutinosa TaxID=7769 RepID=UPI00358F0E5D
MALNPELLRSELEMFVNTGLDDNILEKFQELCIQYQLDEVQIAEEWVAFSFNHNGLNPNLETLERFEYEKLMKLGVKTQTRRRMEDVNSLLEIAEDNEGEELIDSYSTPAKGSQKRQLTTPEQPVSKRKVGQGRSPLHYVSPSIISPSATPSQKYSSRTNAGVVVASYGQLHSMQWQGCQGRTAQVERFTGGHDALLKRYKHMFQGLHDIREVLDQKIEDMGHFLKEAYNIEEFSSLTLPTQETVTVLGQICCDGNGKLNSKSLLLEGNVEISAGFTVPLNISDVKEYSLFPGQVVVMDGINTSGQTFVASKIYEGKPLPFYKPSSEELENVNCEAAMVLVVCGPYTTSEGICFDPLLDLIAVIKRDRPDVCLLLGPFVDITHEQVETCQLKETFTSLLKSCILRIIEETQSLTTQLVFVPSLNDAFHNVVYPLPPYTDLRIPAQDTQRVHFVSEPSTIMINGVVFGLTSTDVFFHMSSEEIASVQMGSPDRFTRLLKHILSQHRCSC